MNKALYFINFWLRFLFFGFNNNLPSKKFIIKNNDLIEYYIKLKKPFNLSEKISLNQLNLTKQGGYNYELYSLIYPLRKHLHFRYIPGDVKHIPDEPTFVKSRPISGDNQNSVLIPMNTIRHFNFISDNKKFVDKNNQIVWRGAAYQDNRIKFLEYASNYEFIDAKNTAITGNNKTIYRKNYLSIKEQLQFKFIVSLEGNDVATNLKWIMSSNSICLMPKPKYETWFMEGTLIPDFHYVEILDDYSDIEEKYNLYKNDLNKCFNIISNANNYCKKFKCSKFRLKLARSVALKYQNLSCS